jgi:hypothetical protein
MKISEAILLAILAAFAASLAVGSLDMQYAGEMTFGPGFLPLNTAIAMLVLIAGCVVRARRRRATQPVGPEAGDARWSRDDAVRMAITSLALILGVAAMTVAGVLGPVFLVMVALSWFIAGHSLPRSLAVSAIVLGIIYLIFVVWLGLPIL